MTTDLPPTPAERAIRRRIARHGPITFAEFMATALYAPGGYYTRSNRRLRLLHQSQNPSRLRRPVRRPALPPLDPCWNAPTPSRLSSPAEGDGLLCRDILTASSHLPDDFADAITLHHHRPNAKTAGHGKTAFPQCQPPRRRHVLP